MMKRWLGIATLGWMTIPSQALACAVCGDPEDTASQVAYIAMTAMLTLLPFALVGGIGFYIWKKLQQQELEELSADDLSVH